MANFSELIAQTNARNKELHSMTVRVPESIKSFIDELTNDFGLSRQDVLLSFIEGGRDSARKELEKTLPLTPNESSTDRRFHLLNTNKGNSDEDQDFMLQKHAAAAFYAPWKYCIEQIKLGDIVFLYQNQVGIIAYGTGTGEPQKTNHQGNEDECFYQVLNNFTMLDTPMKAAEIASLVEKKPVFLRTMSTLREGSKLLAAIEKREK